MKLTSFDQPRVVNKDPIAIIGGGVIGLATGWRLAQAGLKTIIFDKGGAGQAASAAAAGMITPSSEVRFGEHELLKLFLDSHRLFPEFIEDLTNGQPELVDFQRTGSLLLALNHDDRLELERLYDYQEELGLPVTYLTCDEVLKLEPQLSPNFCKAVYAAHDYFLDNLKLIQTLKQAFLAAGGTLHQETEVIEIKVKGERAVALRTPAGEIPTAHIIVASGIENPSRFLLDLDIPLRPVKGQIIHLRAPGAVPIKRAIRTVHPYPVYLVPRSDGRLIIGATNEEKGLDNRVTAGAIQDLLYGAWKILPAIDDMELALTQVGFRATTPDHAPILGPSVFEALTLAMGFYRHGFLLTPLVSHMISQYLIHGIPYHHFQSFGWQRFSQLREVSCA